MASELKRTQAVYAKIWPDSAYTNALLFSYVLRKLFPESDSVWTSFFSECDKRVPVQTNRNVMWENASESLQKGYLFGESKPEWNQEIPDHLWDSGTGMCTTFAIYVNEKADLCGTYIRYRDKKLNEKHRAVHKPCDDTKTTLVVDSGALHVFELRDKESIKDWKNAKGQIVWRKMKPEPVADRNEALRVCLDQLFATAGYTITLYRCLKEDGLGDWREVEGFSPLHKAMKLLKPAHAENYTLQYIVFGMEGDVEDKKVCYDKLVNQPGGKEVSLV